LFALCSPFVRATFGSCSPRANQEPNKGRTKEEDGKKEKGGREEEIEKDKGLAQ
jgi:hypothetical protein